ncbi:MULTISPECIES: hypothetical protein [Streptomyces]|uniref:hypothetical protein n=1 Tax=Streptomyces TaxID=1883 RepID=UPI0004BDE432|nr:MULTISPECIES: hypothetical protein [Streptomyces]KJY23133.1 hypothetical protein VR43_02735 [Streptomyces sp. NRRL S-104]
MHNPARAVTMALSLLFGLLLLPALALALTLGLLGGSSAPLTEEDVIGTWHGDRGARLEVLSDGRALLSNASGWQCARGPEPGVFTGEGSWTLAHLPDENPGIRIRFSPEGTPEVQQCNDWFNLGGTGKEDSAGDGSRVWATFLGYKQGAAERFRRAPTG